MPDSLSAAVLDVLDAYAWGKAIAGESNLAILFEATPYDRVAGATITVRASAVKSRDGHGPREYRTKPTDTPANVRYPGRLRQPYTVRASVIEDGIIGSRAGLTEGAVILDISDRPDHWQRPSEEWVAWTLSGRLRWEGAAGTIKMGGADFALADFSVLRMGTIESIELDRDQVTMAWREPFERLRDPVKRKRYSGTRGPEGAADIKGQLKPFAFGPGPAGTNVIFNVPPVRLGRDRDGRLLYQFFSNPGSTGGGSIVTLYEGGNPLTEDVEWEWDAAEHSVVWIGGTEPTLDITADILGFNDDVATFTRSHAIEQILTQIAGYAAGDVVPGVTTQFRTDAPAAIGSWYGSDEVTYEEIFQTLLAPLGYWSVTRAGKFGAKWLRDPNMGAADLSITWEDLAPDTPPRRLRSAPPRWSQTLRYQRAHLTQSESDLAGVASDEFRLRVQSEWRSLTLSDDRVKDAAPLAVHRDIDTLLVNEDEAKAESLQAFHLYARPRETWEVTLRRQWMRVWIGDVVDLSYLEPDLATKASYDPFSLDTSGNLALQIEGGDLQLSDGSGPLMLSGRSSRRFFVAGIEEDLAADKFTLTLWG